LFTVVPQAPGDLARFTPGPRPDAGAIARVDEAALDQALSAAPAEDLTRKLADYGAVILLPMPDGSTARFAVANSPVMAPGLAARYPWMQTYIVQGIDDKTMAGRIDLTQRGFHALVRTTKGAVFIDPYVLGDQSHVVSYYIQNLNGANDWTCETTEGVHGHSIPPELLPAEGGGGDPTPQVAVTLRTYAFAVACTGEFGAHVSALAGHAPNREDPLAAIVTLANRATAIYEVDVACRFVLVANNDQIIYFDPASDPYPDSCDGTGGADCSGPYLAPNIANLSSVIGNANFDLGHLITRVFGGVAYLPSICSNNKAGGISGIPRGGDIDPATCLVAIHEMGHQFGAGHTFNGTRGRCGNNASRATAWEPGGGSTPMAYPGGCPVGDAPPTDNLVQFADPWFHHGSYIQMRNVATGSGNSCSSQSLSTNNPPEIQWPNASVTFNIPPLTPFALTAQATDPDNDALTYSWEQYNTGSQQPLTGSGSEDNGSSPIFRVFPPVASPTRTFPQLSDILNNVQTPGEQLPAVQPSNRRLRVIVRDNRAGTGGVAVGPGTGATYVTITVPSGTTPFSAIEPAENDDVTRGNATVRWNTGGSQNSPINAANVAIKLSTDGGQTFPIVLAASEPNDGTATVNIPTNLLGGARIKIEAVGNVFFCITRPFWIVSECGAGDFNGDSQIDFFDYLDFVGALEAEAPAADFDHNGQVDFFDYLSFVELYEQGC
jgi:hypothetical protein